MNKEEEDTSQTETTQLHVNDSRKTSSLFQHQGNWSTKAYIHKN